MVEFNKTAELIYVGDGQITRTQFKSLIDLNNVTNASIEDIEKLQNQISTLAPLVGSAFDAVHSSKKGNTITLASQDGSRLIFDVGTINANDKALIDQSIKDIENVDGHLHVTTNSGTTFDVQLPNAASMTANADGTYTLTIGAVTAKIPDASTVNQLVSSINQEIVRLQGDVRDLQDDVNYLNQDYVSFNKSTNTDGTLSIKNKDGDNSKTFSVWISGTNLVVGDKNDESKQKSYPIPAFDATGVVTNLHLDANGNLSFDIDGSSETIDLFKQTDLIDYLESEKYAKFDGTTIMSSAGTINVASSESVAAVAADLETETEKVSELKDDAFSYAASSIVDNHVSLIDGKGEKLEFDLGSDIDFSDLVKGTQDKIVKVNIDDGKITLVDTGWTEEIDTQSATHLRYVAEDTANSSVGIEVPSDGTKITLQGGAIHLSKTENVNLDVTSEGVQGTILINRSETDRTLSAFRATETETGFSRTDLATGSARGSFTKHGVKGVLTYTKADNANVLSASRTFQDENEKAAVQVADILNTSDEDSSNWINLVREDNSTFSDLETLKTTVAALGTSVAGLDATMTEVETAIANTKIVGKADEK